MIAIYSTDIQRRNYPTQLHAWTLIVTLQVNWFFLRQTREKPLQKKKNSSFSIICRTELVDEKPNFVLVKTGLRQCQACPSVSSLPYSLKTAFEPATSAKIAWCFQGVEIYWSLTKRVQATYFNILSRKALLRCRISLRWNQILELRHFTEIAESDSKMSFLSRALSRYLNDIIIFLWGLFKVL